MGSHSSRMEGLDDCIKNIERFGFELGERFKRKVYDGIITAYLSQARAEFSEGDFSGGKNALENCERFAGAKRIVLLGFEELKKELYGVAAGALVASAGKNADRGELLATTSCLSFAESAAKLAGAEIPDLESVKRGIFIRGIDGAIGEAERLAKRKRGSYGVKLSLDDARKSAGYANVKILGLETIEMELVALSESES